MNDYRLSAKDLRSLKSALTKAQKNKNPQKVIDVCNRAFAKFESDGYPDCWSDFQRARDDAERDLTNMLSSLAWGL